VAHLSRVAHLSPVAHLSRVAHPLQFHRKGWVAFLQSHPSINKKKALHTKQRLFLFR
jgi:hypothetical protein